VIQNLEVKTKGEGYVVLEQAGSNYHEDRPIFEAATRGEAESWLAERGADMSQVAKALDDAGSSERVFIEVNGDYSEAEGFPKK
jgi:hypothetical protein